MVRGRRWTVEQETKLKELIQANTNIGTIAAELGKNPGAIIVKSQRLGLQLQSKGYVDSSIVIPKELLSVEEVLKMMAGALKTAIEPGLNKVELQRLQAVGNLAKIYEELFADYVHYRQIENELKEVKEQNERLLKEKTSNDAS